MVCLTIAQYRNLIRMSNVTGGKKSCLNRDSNQGSLAYRISTLTAEILRPDILTDGHTPINPVTYSPSSSNLGVEFYELRKCCETCSWEVTMGFVLWAPNVKGGEKSSLNCDLNPGPLAYYASALTTELLRPDSLTDSHTC